MARPQLHRFNSLKKILKGGGKGMRDREMRGLSHAIKTQKVQNRERYGAICIGR